MNNNRGVTLQTGKKSASMEPCFYGAGCNRKDCIYRHDANVPDAKKSNEACLSFLAGTCSFTAATCKKRHPPKHECERLRNKYKNIKCRFGDECKTVNCLYTHPRDSKEEPVAFLAQSAFPALDGGNSNGSASAAPKSTIVPGSAWKSAPVVAAPKAKEQPALASSHKKENTNSDNSMNANISAQAPAWFPGNPQEEGAPIPEETDAMKKSLNINAKTWVPGMGFA